MANTVSSLPYFVRRPGDRTWFGQCRSSQAERVPPDATKVATAEAVVFFGTGPIARADQPLPALGYLAPEFQKRPGPVRRVVRPADLQGRVAGRARAASRLHSGCTRGRPISVRLCESAGDACLALLVRTSCSRARRARFLPRRHACALAGHTALYRWSPVRVWRPIAPDGRAGRGEPVGRRRQGARLRGPPPAGSCAGSDSGGGARRRGPPQELRPQRQRE